MRQYNPSSVHRKPINYATFNWTVVCIKWREHELRKPGSGLSWFVSACRMKPIPNSFRYDKAITPNIDAVAWDFKISSFKNFWSLKRFHSYNVKGKIVYYNIALQNLQCLILGLTDLTWNPWARDPWSPTIPFKFITKCDNFSTKCDRTTALLVINETF